MAYIEKGKFTSGTVVVDGNYYKNCEFEGVTIQYEGGDPPSFIGCSFTRCELGLGGSASNTIGYLNAIYHGFGEWGRGSVDLLVEGIRNNRPPGVIRPATDHGGHTRG